MPVLVFDEPMFRKETQNFNKFEIGRLLEGENEVRGTFYMPKTARKIKVTIEFE